MDEIRLKALAKINLGLDVLRKREDGYHDVRMIMQTVNLFDKVHIQKIDTPEIKIQTNLSFLPNNENNLMYKAAKLLMDEFSLPKGVDIQLFKYIPVSAGLAGGSTDAASVLFGMNWMYHLGLSVEQLMERGVKIGADVPYCLMRGTALAEGIGEELTRLPACPFCYVVIAKPGISVSTKFVYQNLKADQIVHHPDIDGMIQALSHQDLEGVCASMGNVLEEVTIPAYPIIDKIKSFLLEHGAMASMMSGSGPSVFGIFQDLQAAKDAVFHLRKTRLASSVHLADIMNVKGKDSV